MGGKIYINSCIVEGSVIACNFTVEGDIKKYFNFEHDFIVDYNKEISSVPASVAVIPLIVNILPIIWLTNSVLYVKELDLDFYNSIEGIKKGYEDMHKAASFRGKVIVDALIENDNICSNSIQTCASFFSGGVDATSTLVSVLSEKPILMTLLGADININDTEGAFNIRKMLEDTKTQFGLDGYFIKSTFRLFINEGELSKEFMPIIKDNYWHGLQHGIGLIGHAAPIAFLHKLSTIYIPGTNCDSDLKDISCASDPRIDNQVKFCNTRVYHEGYQFSRQMKIRNIVSFCKSSFEFLSLRVCWISRGGRNCGKCEKCMRTIMGLLAENEDPNKFGFVYNNDTYIQIKRFLLFKSNLNEQGVVFWEAIRVRFVENEIDGFEWFKDVDFNSINFKLKRIPFNMLMSFKNGIFKRGYNYIKRRLN